MKTTHLIHALATAFVLASSSSSFAASVTEDFSTNPLTAGRFTQSTGGTESSFTYNPATQNLTAVLDVDSSAASLTSTPALSPAITDTSNAYFRADLRIDAFDNQASPTVLFGLVTGQHVNDFGDGLTMALDVSTGTPVAYARIDAGSFNAGGNNGLITLSTATDYRVIGNYSGSTRRLIIQIFSGPGFTTLVGTSFADLIVGRNLLVDRIGLQNAGRMITDQTVGSVTLTVDNISTLPEPDIFQAAIYPAVEIAFPTMVGFTYQVQVTPSLSPTTWTNFGDPISGDGTEKSVYDKTRNREKRFYRVVRTN